MTATDEARELLHRHTARALERRHDHLEELAAAFIARTRLDPAEVELVEEHVGHEIRWHFRRRTP